MSRVVITGAAGLLGTALISAFRATAYDVIGVDRSEIDLEEPASLTRISDLRPDLVINAAAWTDVDACALDPERAMRINGDGAGHVALNAAKVGARVVQVSTNAVFAGVPGRAYGEDDQREPVNPYGASKLAGERAVADATENHLIVRTAWLFGPTRGFPARITAVAEHARQGGEEVRVVDDEWGNPTPADALARRMVTAVQLLEAQDGWKTLHLAGEPPTTRYAWARDVLSRMQDPPPIRPIGQDEYTRPSVVPHHAVLATGRSRLLGIPNIVWMGTA